MPAIRISPTNFRVRYFGNTNADRRSVVTTVNNDANAVAGANFMFFDLQTGALVGQFIQSGQRLNLPTGGILDAISLTSNGTVLFHDESAAYQQVSSLVWSMTAGPIIVQGGNFTNATWGKYSTDQLSPTLARQRVALGVTGQGDYILAYRNSINLTDLGGYMKALGCTGAIAGDGGGSARLYLENRSPSLYGSDARQVHVIPVAISTYSFISDLA